jgi:trigger factor
MAPSDEDRNAAALADEQATNAAEDAADQDGEDGGEEEAPLTIENLEAKIESPGTCQRHITVTISAADVKKYFDRKFDDLVPLAQVPGFRAGKAPKELVQARFRKEVTEQVKGALLLDSIDKVNTQYKLAAISEPEFDLEAIEVPTDGPMTFEFDLEVRPDFDMPTWEGLSVERPMYDFTKSDVDRRLKSMLHESGNLVPHDGPAESGDYIVCNLTFRNEGEVLSRGEEETIRIRPVLSFRDGRIEGFDKKMAGVKAGETREVSAKLTDDAPNEKLRGKEVTAEVQVLDVKKLELPEITEEFLEEVGGYGNEDELRTALKSDLERQFKYRQQQSFRKQITALLTKDANWDLPPEMLKRQSQRELERSVLELRRNGFSEQEIRAHANELRQNSTVNTARALKEHFILERIAEDNSIEAQEADYEDEVRLIAMQSGENPRRVRARLEKRGLWDVLRNQIIERKVIELVLEKAKFKDVPFKPEASAEETTEAVDQAAGGGDAGEDIPQAKYGVGPSHSELPTDEDKE